MSQAENSDQWRQTHRKNEMICKSLDKIILMDCAFERRQK